MRQITVPRVIKIVHAAMITLRTQISIGLVNRRSTMEISAPYLDDIALLLAVARRDERAFSELYDRMSPPLFAMVMRIIRVRAEAEEVLQETFWKIWESAASYQPQLGSPFSWMVTIARRKAIDRLRANSRHLDRITEAQAQSGDSHYSLPAGLDELASGENRATLKAALEQLSSDERHAILLAFFDGLTHLEIASALNAPVGTIKARIRRGLIKLESVLCSLQPVSSGSGKL